jgi:1-acyl-sn-glycerol-3-phosphate acyltransferase
LDGFEKELTRAFVGYRPDTAARFWERVSEVSDRLGVRVSGFENLPRGRGLLVMNHAFGWDAILPMAAIRRATGRRVWALGEHLWWKIPWIRTLAAQVGAVDGTPENADQLLVEDELVLVLPGGMREALKPKELRYRLLWGQRYGFVRAALRTSSPLVPVAGIGADDLFDVEGDAFARGRRWLRREFPLPRLSLHAPRAHLEYVIGEPIAAIVAPEETEDRALRRLRREVRGALEEIIDEALAARCGFTRA